MTENENEDVSTINTADAFWPFCEKMLKFKEIIGAPNNTKQEVVIPKNYFPSIQI